jgi:TetR/AcrR family transcriptional regulator, acrAB operon repressor
MGRRTKEDALATRHSLLDAAERLFQAKGVSGTSLNDIAIEAGVSRGAIYWHFKDKADLFNAMMERVSLPLEAASMPEGPEAPRADPLPRLRAAVLHAFEKTATDPQTRRVFEVATHKVEYIDSLSAVRRRHLDVRQAWLARIADELQRSAALRRQPLPIPAEDAARGLYALIDGLIQNWLLDMSQFDLPTSGRRAIDAYFAGLGIRFGK